MRQFFCIPFSGLLWFVFPLSVFSQKPIVPSFHAYEALTLPDLRQTKALSKPLRIAVIDNAFQTRHEAIRDFIYVNPKEISGNQQDDDHNGYVDDISGWDVADQDNQPKLPVGREQFFYHGTMTASVITEVISRSLGKQAAQWIKIIPVKVLSDQAQKQNYEKGYQGIAYALDAGADIIVCAWSGGQYDESSWAQLFTRARKQGVLILGSSGNAYSPKCDPPSSIQSVHAISAVDSHFKKLPAANYHEKIALSPVSDAVYAAHAQGNKTYGYHDGTSAAVALVAGCVAVLKARFPQESTEYILQALIETATSPDSLNVRYATKLGGGIPNVTAAMHWLEKPESPSLIYSKAKGFLHSKDSKKLNGWTCKHSVGLHGYRFTLQGVWDKPNGKFIFITGKDSVEYPVKQFPTEVFLESPEVRIRYEGKGDPHGLLQYQAIAIDSTRLYCRDRITVKDTVGRISDGSGEATYGPLCDCKWQIQVPEGKRVKVVFESFDTEPTVDHVWLFEGQLTLPENILATFSGPDIPPVIVSGSNEVLVWFVTDDKKNYQGWTLRYEATDEEPGVKDPPDRKK